MTPADLRVVFMGTPDFAVPSLEKLYELGCQVVGVASQPDRPKGRGRKVVQTPVAACATRHGTALFQWPRLDNDSYAALSAVRPDVCVVAAYGKILPRRYLELPPHGCINVHASILPGLRGAAPIQWGVINGDREAGVSIMRMDEGMDTGAVALVARTPIGPEETAGELHDRLAVVGADALGRAIARLCAGELRFEPQDHARATMAPRLSKEDGRIDWSRPAGRIHDQVRGTNPWPGAFSGDLKVHRARVADGSGEPGVVLRHEPEGPVVACGEGALLLTELQRPGGKAIPGADFLRGKHELQVGARLG